MATKRPKKYFSEAVEAEVHLTHVYEHKNVI